MRFLGYTAGANRRNSSTVAITAGPHRGAYSKGMQTLVHLLVLYLKYSVVTLALGIVVAAGFWLWLGLASLARSVRDDL